MEDLAPFDKFSIVPNTLRTVCNRSNTFIIHFEYLNAKI